MYDVYGFARDTTQTKSPNPISDIWFVFINLGDFKTRN